MFCLVINIDLPRQVPDHIVLYGLQNHIILDTPYQNIYSLIIKTKMADTRKTVLITGCAPGGIGHALATDFHKAGTIDWLKS